MIQILAADEVRHRDPLPGARDDPAGAMPGSGRMCHHAALGPSSVGRGDASLRAGTAAGDVVAGRALAARFGDCMDGRLRDTPTRWPVRTARLNTPNSATVLMARRPGRFGPAASRRDEAPITIPRPADHEPDHRGVPSVACWAGTRSALPRRMPSAGNWRSSDRGRFIGRAQQVGGQFAARRRRCRSGQRAEPMWMIGRSWKRRG